jgi:hypothetical protein
MIAIVNKKTNPWEQLNGNWVGVPKKIIKSVINLSNSANVLDALSIKISNDQYNNISTIIKFDDKYGDYLILRFLNRLLEIRFDDEVKNKLKINLYIFFNITHSNEVIKIFRELRKRELWESRNFSNSGLLNELNIIPIGNSFPLQMQTFIPNIFPDATGNQMADLLDMITIKREDCFCWIRADDEKDPIKKHLDYKIFDWQEILLSTKRRFKPKV